MAYTCTFEGCLFTEQQVCSRTGNSSPCEYAQDEEADDDADSAEDEDVPASESVVAPPKAALAAAAEGLHTGEELGLLEIGPLMEEQYAHLITILGDYKAGKTSFLVCIYLASACGMLASHGLSFAGSLTLPGFEARARTSRKWNPNNPPDRMTERTVIGEGRGAGFLHLDLVREDDRRRVRLLMSDLPGEWTKNLIDHERHGERLSFLGRSDAILIMIDGEQLLGRTRHVEVDRNRVLIDRIIGLLPDRRPLLQLVATRADKIGSAAPPALAEIAEYARSKGFSCETHNVSTFSQTEGTPCGAGVIEALKASIACERDPPPRASSPEQPTRLFGWLPVMSGVEAG